MYCIHCGSSLPDGARFCSSCGTAQANASTSTPRPADSALLNQQGQPQPAFERLAAAIFHALDQNVQPQRSGGLEVSKMKSYRTLGGLSVPPFYGEHVLPTYASVVGIELVPNQPPTAPVVTWNGWHNFLLQKILAEPDATFPHLQRLVSAMRIPITLNRTDFPIAPSPEAQAKETRFREAIYALMQKSGQQGAAGSGGGGGRVMAQQRLAMANMQAEAMKAAGDAMLQSSSPNSYYYRYGR